MIFGAEFIGTVANAMTIIDYTIKFANFLSPKIRSALLNSKQKLSQVDPSTSAKEVEPIILSELSISFPNKHELKTTTEDLSRIFQLIQIASEEILSAEKEYRVPYYYGIVTDMVFHVSEKLLEWDAFYRWGKRLNDFWYDPNLTFPSYVHKSNGAKIFLPGPYITNQLKQLTYLQLTLGSMINLPLQYQVWHLDSGEIACSGVLTTTDGNYHSLPGSTTSEIKILNKIEIDFTFQTINHSARQNELSFHVTRTEDFQLIINGIIQDLIHYSKAVRGEIEASRSFLDKLGSQYL